MKINRVTNGDGSPYGVSFDCPGCAVTHIVPTTGLTAWEFNGNFDRPTLMPSILVYDHDIMLEDGTKGRTFRCHSYVTDGRIQFLGDCTHPLAGKTVDLPEIVGG